MKLLKYLILLLFIILLGGGIYVALLPSESHLKEEIALQAPRSLVLKELRNLKTYPDWIRFNDIDIRTAFIAESKKKALKWQTTSPDISGSLEELSHNYNKLIQEGYADLSFKRRTLYKLEWDLKENKDTSTTVLLHLYQKSNYWIRLFRIFNHEKARKTLSSFLGKNLEHLKHKILSDMKVFSVNVNGIMSHPEQVYLYATQSSKNSPAALQKLQLKYSQQLKQALALKKVKPTGAAFILFNQLPDDNNNVIISVGIPFSSTQLSKIEESDNQLIGKLPYGAVLKGTLKGNYQKIDSLWAAQKNYMHQHNLEVSPQGTPFEIFKITKENSSNPADWVTELYIPIRKKEKLPFKKEYKEANPHSGSLN